MVQRIKATWQRYKSKHPGIAQFIVFFILCNGVTLLQMLLMPFFKGIFGQTELINQSFQIWPVGQNFDGSQYFVFNYQAGEIAAGGGGGMAYFLAVQLTMAIAQVINFFLQRNVTFKSNSSVVKAAFWYLAAYLVITVGASAAQGIYKAPIYELLINTWGLGKTGETIADVVTMIINAAISFWVFYPIFKVIFKQEDKKEHASA